MNNTFDRDRLQTIAHKIREGIESTEEMIYFNAWYTSYNDELLEIDADYVENELVLKNRIQEGINKRIHQKTVPFKRYHYWFAIAASLILLIGPILVYQNLQYKNTLMQAPLIADIDPGKEAATLILSNGEKISLEDADNTALANEGGFQIAKTSEGQIIYRDSEVTKNENKKNILQTDWGQTYHIILPDGTKVWLNAGTTLTFYTQYTHDNKRLVEVDGEAYFEVSLDKAHPFIVRTSKQDLQVLGTMFNIRAYQEERYNKSSLLEGSVKIMSRDNANIQYLKPGQYALFDAQKFKVGEADLEVDLAWKNGDFIFKNENISSMMNNLERWYNIKFIYNTAIRQQQNFTGKICRCKKLSAILSILEEAGNIKFTREGRNIYVDILEK